MRRFHLALLILIALIVSAPAQTAYATYRTGKQTVWEIYDINVYQSNKAGFDFIAAPLDSAAPLLTQWFAEFAPLKVDFHVNKGGCSSDWNNPINFTDTCAIPDWPRRWTKTFLMSRLADIVWNAASTGWPDDAFGSGFRMMLTSSLIRSVEGADSVTVFENEYMDKTQRPQYLAYMKLKDAKGWGVFRELFRAVKKDTLIFDQLPQTPAELRGNYMMAYLNLGNLEKLAVGLKSDGVLGFDPVEVTKILTARNLLAIADRRGLKTQPAWEAFRSGQYGNVKGLLGTLPTP